MGPLDRLKVDALLVELPERAHIPELVDDGDNLLRDVIHLALRGETAEPHANRRVCVLVIEAESSEDVGWLEGSRCAGATGRQADVLESHQETLAFDELETQVDAARVATIWVAVDEDLVYPGENVVLQSLSQS